MEHLQEQINLGPSSRTEREWIGFLFQLSERVLNRYYFGYPLYRDDLIQEGVIKANDLVNQGHYDSERSTMYNYLFTGIRNQMSNFIKKMPSDIHIDLVPEVPVYDTSPDMAIWEDTFECDALKTVKSNVIALMEGRIVLNLWTGVSEEEKAVFVKIIQEKTKLKDVQTIYESSGDLILWALLLYAGERVSFPPESVLEKYLRQAKVYYLLEKGLDNKEVSQKVGLRVQHINRIGKSVALIMDKAGERDGDY